MTSMSVSQIDGPLEGILLDGRYLLQTPIAVGGMSTVYRGLDTRLEELDQQLQALQARELQLGHRVRELRESAAPTHGARAG